MITNTYITPRRNAQPPAKAQTRFVVHYTMPRLTADQGLLEATLAARVLNPNRRPNVSGKRDPLGFDLGAMGGGRPRKPSAKWLVNHKAVYGNKPRHDYLPAERERTYAESLERIVDLQAWIARS